MGSVLSIRASGVPSPKISERYVGSGPKFTRKNPFRYRTRPRLCRGPPSTPQHQLLVSVRRYSATRPVGIAGPQLTHPPLCELWDDPSRLTENPGTSLCSLTFRLYHGSLGRATRVSECVSWITSSQWWKNPSDSRRRSNIDIVNLILDVVWGSAALNPSQPFVFSVPQLVVYFGS